MAQRPQCHPGLRAAAADESPPETVEETVEAVSEPEPEPEAAETTDSED
jgi:hypothetical protein